MRTASPIRTTLLITLALALTTLAGCSSGGGDDQALRIGYQDIANGALVVKHEKWLEDAIDQPVRWVRYPSGAAVNRAFAANKVDVGLVGSTGVAAGISTGLAYQVVWIYDVIGKAEELVARPGTGVTSISALAGKTVAVPFGSTAHYALLVALEHAGVDSSKVTIVDLQPGAIVKAWQDKTIDAAYLWGPNLDKLKQDGGSVVMDSARLAARGQFTADLGVATDAVIKASPETVQTWIDAEDRAATLIQSHPAKAAKAIGAELGTTAAQARQEMAGYRFLTAAGQSDGAFLGTPNNPGDLAGLLTKAAVFQHDYPETVQFGKEKVYTPEPKRKQFLDAVNPTFVNAASREGGQ